VTVDSSEIAQASLRVALPWYLHIYTMPFVPFYPLFAYAYYVKYDDWLRSEEWTFLACVLLGAGHALSYLITRWNAGAKAWVTTRKVCPVVPICVYNITHKCYARLAPSKTPTAYV
jgi:cation-transporting ATPase 13A1